MKINSVLFTIAGGIIAAVFAANLVSSPVHAQTAATKLKPDPSNRLTRARPYLENALKEAQGIDDKRLQGIALQKVVAAMADAGDFDGASRTAQTIDDVNVKAGSMGSIAIAQAKAGDGESAMKTAEAQAKLLNKPYAYWTLQQILEAQAKSGDSVGALRTAEKIQAKDLGLHLIAIAQAEAGDFPAARRTAEPIAQHSNPSIAEHSNALFQRAIATVQSKKGDITGVENSIKAQSSAFVRSFGYMGIVDALLDIPEPGDPAFYASSSTSKSKSELANRLSKARPYLEKALKEAQDIKEEGKDPGAAKRLRNSVLRFAVYALADGQDFVGASRTLETMDVADRLRSMQRIALAQAKAGDVESAMKTAEALGKLFPENISEALQSIIKVQARSGDIAGALRTAEKLKFKDFWLSDIAIVQAETGDFPAARRTMETIQEPRNKAEVQRTITASQCRKGDMTGAGSSARACPTAFERSQGFLGIVDAILDLPKHQ